MKPITKLQKWIPTALLGLTLSGAAAFGQASDFTINQFNTTGEGNWFRFWGVTNMTATFDATLDASNNPASGSLKLDSVFAFADNASGAAWNGSKYAA